MKKLNIGELLVFVIQQVNGDPFEALLKYCEPVVLNAMKNRYIRGYDRDDFMQEAREVLIKAVKNYKFDTDLRFLQYFSMCLESHYNGLLRKDTALKRRSMKWAYSISEIDEGQQLKPGGAHLNPEGVLIAKEMLNDYLIGLSAFEREVFTYYLSDFSYEQIARKMNCNVDKAKAGVYRCSRKFKKLMEKDA